MVRELKRIRHFNGFHGTLIVSLLYFEKVCWGSLIFKLIRIIFIRMFYNCEISPDNFASKEEIISLRLPHPFLIIIHKTAKIGKNCVIFHNCTLGIVEDKGVESGPRLGDNVYVGCGATLLGNYYIEDGIKIGANALVLCAPKIGLKALVGVIK